MTITILTLFPDMFEGPFSHSILKRAQEKGLLTIRCLNIRDFGLGKHKIVDDTVYGGGVGMLMRVDVLHKAIESARIDGLTKDEERVILMDAAGEKFSQPVARKLTEYKHLIVICGHYEGVDERIREYIDEELSVGEFVVTGGEIPAMLVTDAVSRLIPGVITEGATENESYTFTDGGESLLEYPQYTKPDVYEGKNVPDILLSGHHKKIHEWRLKKSQEKSKKSR